MRKQIVKCTRRVLAAALAVAVCVLTLSGCSSYTESSKQIMERLNIAAQLTKNGDMQVKETWRVNLMDRDRGYRNLYRTFELDSSRADGVADFGLYDADSKTPYRSIGDFDAESSDDAPDRSFYTHQTGNLLEFGWFMPEIESGVRTFVLSYTVKNIMAVHADAAVLYNFFLPKNFSLPITELTGTIQLPADESGTTYKTYAWLHTTVGGSLAVNSPDKVFFRVEKIPAKTSVEVRLCAPPTLFAASTKRDSQTVLPSIRAEEQKWANEYAAELQRQYLLGVFDAAGAAFLLLAGIVALILAKRKYRRHRVETPEYTRDIPPGNSPGGVANLFYFYEGGVGKREEGRVFSATLLSLARKGYVSFRQSDERNFAVAVNGKTKDIPLTESEQTFYNMVSVVAERYDGSFTMQQFRDFAESDSKCVDRYINDFLVDSKREISSRGYYESRPAFLAVLKAVGTLAVILAFAVFFLSSGSRSTLVYIPLALVLDGILCLIAGSARQRLSNKGEYDLGVWQGLKKFMLEFSRMKEYGVPQLTLWEEYLVYATMMGISKQVCAQLKLVYPELNDEAYVDTYFGGSYLYYMFGPHLYMRGWGSTAGPDFGASLAGTIGDIRSAATRLANPPPADHGNFGGGLGGGGFGGGGFGGGGGGFGGGGGGGVR